MTGVSGGLAVTLGILQPHPELLTQMLGCLLIGGSVGGFAASRIEVTSLPQMVALFHRFASSKYNSYLYIGSRIFDSAYFRI